MNAVAAATTALPEFHHDLRSPVPPPAEAGKPDTATVGARALVLLLKNLEISALRKRNSGSAPRPPRRQPLPHFLELTLPFGLALNGFYLVLVELFRALRRDPKVFPSDETLPARSLVSVLCIGVVSVI